MPSANGGYTYVTPSTASENSTGDTGSAQQNTAHTSAARDFCCHFRQPRYPAAIATTKDTAATTSTHIGMSVDAMAAEIPASHRM